MSDWQGWATLAAVLFGTYLVVLWISALAWVYRDVRSRTTDQLLQGISVLLVFAFNIPGLLLYLILRPKDTLIDAYERRLEAEALLREINEQAACPTCRRKINDEFTVCPYCRTTLRVSCESCGKSLTQTWVLCPYCGKDRAPAAPRPMIQRASAAPAAAAAAPGATPPPPITPADAKSQVMSPARARRPSTARFTPPAPQGPPAPASDTASDA